MILAVVSLSSIGGVVALVSIVFWLRIRGSCHWLNDGAETFLSSVTLGHIRGVGEAVLLLPDLNAFGSATLSLESISNALKLGFVTLHVLLVEVVDSLSDAFAVLADASSLVYDPSLAGFLERGHGLGGNSSGCDSNLRKHFYLQL